LRLPARHLVKWRDFNGIAIFMKAGHVFPALHPHPVMTAWSITHVLLTKGQKHGDSAHNRTDFCAKFLRQIRTQKNSRRIRPATLLIIAKQSQ